MFLIQKQIQTQQEEARIFSEEIRKMLVPVEYSQSVKSIIVSFNEYSAVNSFIGCESWETFSDHKLVKITTNTKQSSHNQTNEQPDNPVISEVGPRYSKLDFHKAPWETIKEKLAGLDWTLVQELLDICPQAALSKYHDMVLEILEESQN